MQHICAACASGADRELRSPISLQTWQVQLRANQEVPCGPCTMGRDRPQHERACSSGSQQPFAYVLEGLLDAPGAVLLVEDIAWRARAQLKQRVTLDALLQR